MATSNETSVETIRLQRAAVNYSVNESAAEVARLRRDAVNPNESTAERYRLLSTLPSVPTPKQLTDVPDNLAQNEATTYAFNDKTSFKGSSSDEKKLQASAAIKSAFKPKEDWRVRLSLAPGADYLYKAKDAEGILLPLKDTDGVIFPYTPNIVVQYSAQYDSSTLTHSNYKVFQYGSSSVDSITITCDFTAQDTQEANYLLAVIHFFKSVTKMFYGNDSMPRRGTPPPLCYLTGLGQFQFDAHPLAITGFNYTLPTDVDYIRSGSGTTNSGVDIATGGTGSKIHDQTLCRLINSNLLAGANPAPPKFNLSTSTNLQATYVPTKMIISITALPIVTRNDISNNFSLREYATGKLLQGSQRNGGGIW